MKNINNAVPESWKKIFSQSGIANSKIKLRYVLIFLWVLFVGSVAYIAILNYSVMRDSSFGNILTSMDYDSRFADNYLHSTLIRAFDKTERITGNAASSFPSSDSSEKSRRAYLARIGESVTKLIREFNFVSFTAVIDSDGQSITATDQRYAHYLTVSREYGGIVKAIKYNPGVNYLGFLSNDQIIPNGHIGLIYASPVYVSDQKTGRPKFIGTAFVVVPLNRLAEAMAGNRMSSKVQVTREQRVVPDNYVSKHTPINVKADGAAEAVTIYVTLSRTKEGIRAAIMRSIILQLEVTVFLAVLTTVFTTIIGYWLMMLFGRLFSNIKRVQNNQEIIPLRFSVAELNEVMRLVVSLKSSEEEQYRIVQTQAESIKAKNDTLEKQSKELKDYQANLEKKVEERTLALRTTLNRISQNNKVNSAIISCRPQVSESPEYGQMFQIYQKAVAEFDLHHNFFMKIKVRNEEELRSPMPDVSLIDPDENEIRNIAGYKFADSCYTFPVIGRNCTGVLVIKCEVAPIDQGVANIIQIFCRDMASTFDNYYLNKKLQLLATTDGLTGLQNRLGFERVIGRYSRISNSRLGFFLIDVNGLKEMNDKMGHEWGDELLRNVSVMLQDIASRHSRTSLYRIGGDEFVVILEGSDIDSHETIAGEFKEVQGNKVRFFGKDETPVYFSYGYAESPETAPNSLYTVADERMYAMKEAYYEERMIKYGETRKPRH